MYCSTCGDERRFERTPCLDGHGADCPERACAECGAAVLAGPDSTLGDHPSVTLGDQHRVTFRDRADRAPSGAPGASRTSRPHPYRAASPTLRTTPATSGPVLPSAETPSPVSTPTRTASTPTRPASGEPGPAEPAAARAVA